MENTNLAMNNSNSTHLEYVKLMLERTLDNKALARILFEKLFTILPKQLDDLFEALIENEISKANQIIHDIQGVVGNCGLINLEYYAQKIDTYLSIENLKDAQNNFRILQNQSKVLLDCEKEILATLKTL